MSRFSATRLGNRQAGGPLRWVRSSCCATAETPSSASPPMAESRKEGAFDPGISRLTRPVGHWCLACDDAHARYGLSQARASRAVQQHCRPGLVAAWLERWAGGDCTQQKLGPASPVEASTSRREQMLTPCSPWPPPLGIGQTCAFKSSCWLANFRRPPSQLLIRPSRCTRSASTPCTHHLSPSPSNSPLALSIIGILPQQLDSPALASSARGTASPLLSDRRS